MHALGPVAFTANMRTSLLGIAQTFTKISKNKIYELLPHNYYLFNLCFTSRMMETACLEIAHQLLGRDEQNINYVKLYSNDVLCNDIKENNFRLFFQSYWDIYQPVVI